MDLEILKKDLSLIPTDQIAAAIATLAALQVSLAARLMTAPCADSSPSNGDRVLDADQAAEILNVKRSKVYELARQKAGGPPFFHIGKYPRISEADLRK